MVERIAAADLVTLTITEGAYERGGMLDLLARGIAARDRAAHRLSCDNVPRNGEVLRASEAPPRRVPVHDGRPHRPAPADPLTVVAEPFCSG